MKWVGVGGIPIVVDHSTAVRGLHHLVTRGFESEALMGFH